MHTAFHPILILSSHLGLGLLQGLFTLSSPTKILYEYTLSPLHAAFHPILILPSHLGLGLLQGLFTLRSPTKILYEYTLSPMHAAFHPILLHNPNIIWRTVLILKVVSHAMI